MNMTPRLKKLLIATGVVAVFGVVWIWVIMPRVFPSIACIYWDANGEVMKGWGQECSEKEGAIILTRD